MKTKRLFAHVVISKLVAYGYEAEELKEFQLYELVQMLKMEDGKAERKQEWQVTRLGRLFFGEKYKKAA